MKEHLLRKVVVRSASKGKHVLVSSLGMIMRSLPGTVISRLAAAAAVCIALVAPAVNAADAQIQRFPSEEKAREHCSRDAVWLKLDTRIWYYKGQEAFGNAQPGAFVCMYEAAEAGAHANDLVYPPYKIPKYTALPTAPSHIIVAGSDEAGERLVVSGRVMTGATPVANASIYVFQTDATGHYTRGGMDEKNARLNGAVRTDSQGRFSYETIRPARYGNNPAHVHYVVNASAYRSRMVELWFEDDPAIAARRAAGQPVVPIVYPLGVVQIEPVTRDASGVWHCNQTIELKPDSGNPTE